MRRARSEAESALAQVEREKHILTQTLNVAHLEAQQALRKASCEHQEEVEKLVTEKVRSLAARFQMAINNVTNQYRSTSSSLFAVVASTSHLQEALRQSLTVAHDSALKKLRHEVEEELHKAQKEKEELQSNLTTLMHDRDQSLLQAEAEKQQVSISLGHMMMTANILNGKTNACRKMEEILMLSV